MINSGNANAATGEQGLADARATAAETARLLGLEPGQVLVLSTGVIGVPLPMERMLPGVAKAADALSPRRRRRRRAGDPHDRHAHEGERRNGDGFSVGGMAKGSGMIHPNLATMLAVVTTDYPLEPGEAMDFLRPAVEESFNSISVDGECSTNDAVVLLSSGAGGGSEAARKRIRRRTACRLRRSGASRSWPTAKVRRWSLRSTSPAPRRKRRRRRWRGESRRRRSSRPPSSARDANWGRVLAAAGSAPYNGGYANLDPSLVTLSYTAPRCSTAARRRASSRTVSGSTCAIDLDLGLGSGAAHYRTTDLSYDYVRINADYRS